MGPVLLIIKANIITVESQEKESTYPELQWTPTLFVGADLSTRVFNHSMLCVAFSPVKRQRSLKAPIRRNRSFTKVIILIKGPFGRHDSKKTLKLSAFRSKATMRIHT
jgi:hypothetical protein